MLEVIKHVIGRNNQGFHQVIWLVHDWDLFHIRALIRYTWYKKYNLVKSCREILLKLELMCWTHIWTPAEKIALASRKIEFYWS